METIKDLLRKIKKLADKGIGGERVAAQAKLTMLLEKNNLTLEDIIDPEVKYHSFSYSTSQEKKILYQCVAYIMQTGEVQHLTRKGGKSIAFEVTKAEAADIASAYHHYKKEFKKDYDFFFTAFVSKHRLGIEPDDEQEDTMSPEEAERLVLMMGSMRGLKWNERKQLK